MSKIINYWDKYYKLQTRMGLIGAIKYIIKKILFGYSSHPSILNKNEVLKFYDFIYESPFGNNSKATNKTINWVIPDFNIGSGGHLNIFRVVKKLEEMEYSCRINIDGGTHFTSNKKARECIRKHFFPIEAEVTIGRKELLPAAATFATGWTTAYTVRDFKGSGIKYYFVQDFEPFFSAVGSDYIFAEQTYSFKFKGITAGNWLAEKLSREYKMNTTPFGFSYDRKLYYPLKKENPKAKKVFYYARPVTSRRAFELGLLTLNSVHQKNPDIEFILAGWDISSYKIPFPYKSEGISSLENLPFIYSQCDVALVLSFTNLSLLPLEAMACECAIVSNKGENVEWLLNKNNTRLADSTPEALSDAIINLFENPKDLDNLKNQGRKFAETTSWDDEIEKIAMIIQRDLK